ncbi:unnamed protein product [Mytilus edulis]|uniref:Fibronectin type-III domain-containing protein n=1 Tax=Mytilus edulis TaxID=6550 RepID=A0A8S3R0J7_MYTED|nr:unnamed protein product [Mytilus edulis]
MSTDARAFGLIRQEGRSAIVYKRGRGNGESCTDVAQCTMEGAICSDTCQCPSDLFYDGTNCVKRALGESCSDVTQCSADNTICTGSGTKTCECQNTHLQVGTSCLSKSALGDSCTDVAQCTATNAVCTGEVGSQTCQCPNTHYNDGTNCAPKKELGVACTESVQCADTESECSSICYCKSMFYDSNNSNLGGICKPLTELKVTNPALTTRSETFLEIEWTAPTASGAVEEFRYQVGSGSVISVNKKTTANITGLTPGNMYTIKIISVDKDSRPTEQTTYVQISFATKPAVPGPIDLGNSDLTASDGQITIRWTSTGTVTNYTVTISELVPNPTVINNPFYVIGNGNNAAQEMGTDTHLK